MFLNPAHNSLYNENSLNFYYDDPIRSQIYTNLDRSPFIACATCTLILPFSIVIVLTLSIAREWKLQRSKYFQWCFLYWVEIQAHCELLYIGSRTHFNWPWNVFQLKTHLNHWGWVGHILNMCNVYPDTPLFHSHSLDSFYCKRMEIAKVKIFSMMFFILSWDTGTLWTTVHW